MKINRNILFINNSPKLSDNAPASEALADFAEAVEALDLKVHFADSVKDGITLLQASPHFSAIGLYWGRDDAVAKKEAAELAGLLRSHGLRQPLFLISERDTALRLPLDLLEVVTEYVYLFSETPPFIAERVKTAIEQYYEKLLPVYFKTLKDFAESGDYYWDCPGHMGGMAYLKHPVGVEFINFFGENIMRADIGVATGEMGDYLEHVGPPKAAEDRAAKLFGSDWTFSGVGGSSTSNRIVTQGAIGADEIAVVDRNCHKSLNHGLTLSRARPVYLKPTRNGYGMIGPIPAKRLSREHIRGLIKKSALAKNAVSQEPTYAVVTNCTYDGFCYNVNKVVEALSASVPRLHFDEAWYAYAKFHPLYAGRFAMGVDPAIKNQPTIFAVQSTHKMLPAMTMASMIHVKKSPRAPLEYHDFNDAFMMHGTTSPFYPIIASMDVAVSMLEGEGGQALMRESIRDAIGFRKAVVSVKRRLKEERGKNEWFFDVLQPREVKDPKTKKSYRFEEAPNELLASDPTCWLLGENEDWHGFAKDDIAGTDCMMDPVKVTITCPGITPAGKTEKLGIPGYVVTKFLDDRKTEIARTGDYTLLILFSVGTTKAKWGTLLESLIEFKRLYDTGASVAQAIPSLAKSSPAYADMTLKELCDKMHGRMTDLGLLEHLEAAVNTDPEPVLTPAEAFQKVVRYQAEPVKVSEFAGRIAASMLVPYPPGIPVLMPGERVPVGNSGIIGYLNALQSFDKEFPGFEHEVHGVHIDDEGQYWVRAIVEENRKPNKPKGLNLTHVSSTSAKKGRQ